MSPSVSQEDAPSGQTQQTLSWPLRHVMSPRAEGRRADAASPALGARVRGAVQETADGGPRHEQRDDEQRHRDEAAEAHGTPEDDVDQLEDDELAPNSDRPQRRSRDELGAGRRGGPKAAQDMTLQQQHRFQRGLEEHCGHEREREGFADHRRDELDSEVEHDDVDEHIDDVSGAGAPPTAKQTTALTGSRSIRGRFGRHASMMSYDRTARVTWRTT